MLVDEIGKEKETHRSRSRSRDVNQDGYKIDVFHLASSNVCDNILNRGTPSSLRLSCYRDRERMVTRDRLRTKLLLPL
ncbi:hypothetical protein L2E82_28267 [Cichorium intybus]|uniref:Uncharacterized protein n=1 Tax=Cichorium intybus TaxID=13427 RepID=A0ACB9CVC4_CICIN|nr:hypothetical protein L2E82_28267 [Cichorium intybus]